MVASLAALLQQATQLHRQGRLPEAERAYRAALERDPKSFEALHFLGMLKMQQGFADEATTLVSAAIKRNPGSCDALMLLGSIKLSQRRFDEALGCFDRAVVLQPKNVDARYNRAVAFDQAGRLPQALADYDQVAAVQPRAAPVWINRANVLARMARFGEALESYDRALAIEPGNADALNNRGNTLAALHRHADAEASFDRALAQRPTWGDALSNRATSLKALGRLPEALAGSERALAAEPNNFNALVTRGNVLQALARHADALASYERALAIAPHDTDVIANRGLSLIELNRADEAVADAEQAVAREPGHPAAHYARGNALAALARYAEAVTAYEKALALRPDYPDVYYTFGLALQALERHDEAVPYFAKAIAHRPDFADPKYASSTSYLAGGAFEQGWPLLDHRWAPHIRTGPPREYPQPIWDGTPLPGTLLVWGEQGPGDQVLYASLLSRLKPLAGRIVVETDPRLVGLFARSFPDFEVVPLGPALYEGKVDAHLPIGSVPGHFVRGWDDFPKRERGFLLPDPGRVRELRQRIASDGKRTIGLSWISKNLRVGKFKSAELKDFESLLRQPGYRFVDLQYGDTAAERAAVERELGVRVEHLDDIDNRNDLDGLAALIAACDAVVTVSSITAHMAGAVGTPTWVMLPYGRGRFWYWFAQKPTSPWYPCAQVRRQEQGQTWPGLIAKLVPEVTAAAVMPWTPPAVG